MKQVLLLSFALLGLSLGAEAQSCWIENHKGESTIQLPPVDESTASGTTIAQYQLVNVRTTATVSGPYNSYLAALRYTNGVYVISTTPTFPNFVTNERATEIRRTVSMTCEDGTTVRVTLIVPVPDTQNQEPTFSESSYDVNIRLPLIPSGNYTTVRTNIVALDKDLDFANGDVYITSSSRYFPVSVHYTATAAGHSYQVDLLADVTILEGSYTTILTADDGRHLTNTVVRITVLPPGTPEPEPTEPVTYPTTEENDATTPEPEPVTEGPEEPEPSSEDPQTSEPTTEDPATDAPTTEKPEEETPEVEPTNGPTTTRITTTSTAAPTDATTVPTTPAPSQSCGLTGLDAEHTITLAEPLDQLLAPGTEIWRHPLYNVSGTTAVNHPHNRYLNAFRGSVTYWMTLSPSYPNFIKEQDTNIIERTVNFQCTDGSVVQYHFQFEIDNEPSVEPTLPPSGETLFKAWLGVHV